MRDSVQSVNTHRLLWLPSLTYSLSSWVRGNEVSAVLHFFLVFEGYRFHSVFEATSQISVLTLSKMEKQHWTWLFLKDFSCLWMQVTIGFLWLMLLLLFIAINGNTNENVFQSLPDKVLVSLWIFSNNLFLLHSNFVENHHSAPKASTEFLTLLLPPQVIRHLQLPPSFWKTRSTRERSGKILAPAGEQKDRHLGGMRGHRAAEWGQVMQGSQLDDHLLQWRLTTWAVVWLRCRKKMDLVMTLSNALFRSGEAGENEILQVVFWRYKFPFSPGDTTVLITVSSLPNFQLWVLCTTQRIWWQKHSTCSPYCWPQEFQAVLSPPQSPILLSAHRWSLI